MRTGTVLPGAAVTPDPDAVAVGEIVGAHALRQYQTVGRSGR